MIVAQCDKCKATSTIMNAIELKVGSSDGHARDGIGMHYCDACAESLGIGEFIHRLSSAGAQRLAQPAPKADIAGPNTPVPVDPRFIKKIQGR